jgi:hypothetical protein
VSACATAGCDRTPQWPSVRRSLTWCEPCLAALAQARGYTPAEPLTGPKQRWLLTHDACGKARHSNLATVRKTGPVCPTCKGRENATWVRAEVMPTFAMAILRAIAVGDLEAAREYAGAFAHRYAWTAERIRELFASIDADLLDDAIEGDGLDPLSWRCQLCGNVDASAPERLLGAEHASWMPCRACDQQRLRHDPAALRRYFSTRGLELLSSPAADRSVAYDARCSRCGTGRRVSVMTLTSGSPPCLRCDGQHLDPSAPHRVYLFAFPLLSAYKIGITHCEDDSRLRAHLAQGGQLLESVTVPDRAAAVMLERLVLDRFRRWPADVHAGHFPQGGWTECWDARAGHPSLADLQRTLEATLR